MFTLLSPAKINLLLDIVGKRSDGYHNIISVVQTVSLYDVIEVEPIKQNKIIVECNIKNLCMENNLCYKVVSFIKEQFLVKSGVKILIKKHIPLGSGLGGASSNAATVLKFLLQLWKIKVDKSELIRLVSKIGKDIPYFFYNSCCLVESTGEKIIPLIPCWKNNPLWILLIYPQISLSTKEVYERFDIMLPDYKPKSDKKNILKWIKIGNFQDLLYNALQPVAEKLCPELKQIKILLAKGGFKNINMSGSGSTIYAVFNNEKEMFKCIDFLKKYSNYKIFIVKTIN